jgi:hypothetical protein
MTEDLRKKQRFLRTEIIDKNYDSQEFIKFLESKKTGGASIQSWTFDELPDLLAEFCSTHLLRITSGFEDFEAQPKPKDDDGSLGDIPNKRTIETTKRTWTRDEVMMKRQKTALSRSTFKPGEDFNLILKCTKAEPNVLTECENLKIEIGQPEKVKAKLLAADYIIFRVSTVPMGWDVKRRYKDFLWLFDCMKAHFPFNYLPNIPAKIIDCKTSHYTIIKRMKNFKEFLNLLADDNDFKTCDELVQFLSLGEGEFQRYKNNFGDAKQAIVPPSKIKDLRPKDIDNYDIKRVVSKIISVTIKF